MEPDIGEALRYLGAGRGAPAELRREMEAVAAQAAGVTRPRHVCKVFPLERAGEDLLLAGTAIRLTGRMAGRMLANCGQAALLACTLGAEFDGALRAWQARDMSRAVMLDAWGSAWVEAGCDAAEGELRARLPGKYLTDRFSPGYGDLPLDLQSAICAALDAQRRIGLCVTASLMLDPVKSVTAVVGIADTPQPARIRGCAFCAMGETCTLRKGGKTCVS